MLKISLVMCVVLFLGLFLAVLNPVFAQSEPLTLQWNEIYAVRSYNYRAVIPSSDGGFIISVIKNITIAEGASDLSLVKTDSVGGVEWIKNNPEFKMTPIMMCSVDSGYLLCYGYYNWSLLKVDSQGDFEWSRPFTLISDAAVTRQVSTISGAKNDNYIMVIYESATRAKVCSSFFKYYNANGDLLWEKTFSQIDINVVLPFDDAGDESYFVAGTQDGQFWFAKLDSTGEVVWSRTYGGYRHSAGWWLSFGSMIQTGDGGFLLGGGTSGEGWLVKTDCNGSEQWGRKYDSYIACVAEYNDGQFLVFSGSSIVCVNDYGRELWCEPYSKYVVDLDDLPEYTKAGVSYVSAGIGEEGNLVVVASYWLDNGSGTAELGLWLASFAVDISSFASGDDALYRNVLLYGVMVVAVVVFVGCLVYLKKRRRHGL